MTMVMITLGPRDDDARNMWLLLLLSNAKRDVCACVGVSKVPQCLNIQFSPPKWVEVCVCVQLINVEQTRTVSFLLYIPCALNFRKRRSKVRERERERDAFLSGISLLLLLGLGGRERMVI